MRTGKASMLGRTLASVPCHCCNDPRIDKGTARRREEKRWRMEAERELYGHEAYKVFDGKPANTARW